VCHPLRKIAAFSKRPAWSNDISGWDTNARSTRIGIGISRCVYSNTRIGSYCCVPVSSVLYWGLVVKQRLFNKYPEAYKRFQHIQFQIKEISFVSQPGICSRSFRNSGHSWHCWSKSKRRCSWCICWKHFCTWHYHSSCFSNCRCHVGHGMKTTDNIHSLIPCVGTKVIFTKQRDVGISYCRILLNAENWHYQTGISESSPCDCGVVKETSNYFLLTRL